MNRRSVLAMISAAPLVVKTDLLSRDDLLVLELAVRLEDSDEPGRDWDGESEMSDVIRSLARRGYLEVKEIRGETRWYRPTSKARAALDASADT
jgi:hypothetical protein